VGYRVRPADQAYVGVVTFFNHLTDTLSTELLTPFVETSPPPSRVVLPVTFANGLHGSTYGTEVHADVRPTPWWRMTAHYAYLRIEMTRDPGGRDVSQERRYEGLSPRHAVHVQAAVDLPGGWSADWLWRAGSALPAGPVEAYASSDARVGWEPRPGLELSIVGQNLHRGHHREWPGGAEAERNVHLRVTFRR
jgi:iron complex outermembrane receptor protein